MSERNFSIPQMKEILPCAESMLLLDRAVQLDDTHIVGLKSVTLDELVFLGHFPGHPIMPGVLQVEAIAQLAELALHDKLNPQNNLDFYVKELNRVKFRRPNNPGDRLRIEVEIRSVTDSEADISAVVRNAGGVACQAEMKLSVREKQWDYTIPDFNEFDKTDSIVMDVNKIMSFIPHRYPFLFVDYVSKITEQGHVTAVKNATNSELIFRNYRDGYKVLMGSVQPEIVAQAGCIYMLSNPNSKGKIAYFMGIDHAEFFHPVMPGDQMRLEVDIPDNTKRFGKGEGCMMVNDRIVSNIRMTFAIVDP